MVKNTILSLLIILTIGCKAQKTDSSAIVDKDGSLVGIATKDAFLTEPFSEWFVFNYNAYEVDQATIDSLKPLLNNITIKAFMGTWCGDSQSQTPVFYKVIESANFNIQNLTLVAVDTNKKTPKNLQKGYDIKYVPTFIFFKNGEEIGRIVEYPITSIEADILTIVSGKPYKHAYQD
ncbi:thioredoxin [Lutibacter sp. HS1-25]|uniref:thioredoxin family protein n=1 Tax=Lutibacter sp. HS1-25 TaxID=2485000 RepID=UPI0010107A29|nr:thioredoxin family protein [Lutibacter sp. HS1-25]RXP44950.1 thioredoxin [Lutibacter sp. HS1-25]